MGMIMKEKKIREIRKASKNDTLAINEKAVEKLAHILNDTNLTEIEYEEHDCRIRVSRHIEAPLTAPIASSVLPTDSVATHDSVSTIAPSTQPDDPEVSRDMDLSIHPGVVKSPMVGTVYLAAQPDAPNFINEGDTVSKGDTLLIIEAMKVMNPIRAPQSGKIEKILAKTSEPVEYDDPLVLIT